MAYSRWAEMWKNGQPIGMRPTPDPHITVTRMERNLSRCAAAPPFSPKIMHASHTAVLPGRKILELKISPDAVSDVLKIQIEIILAEIG